MTGADTYRQDLTEDDSECRLGSSNDDAAQASNQYEIPLLRVPDEQLTKANRRRLLAVSRLFRVYDGGLLRRMCGRRGENPLRRGRLVGVARYGCDSVSVYGSNTVSSTLHLHLELFCRHETQRLKHLRD